MFSSHLLTHFKQKEIVPDSTLDNFYDIESISRQNEKYSDFSKLKTFTQPLIQAILEKNISDLNKALAQPIKKTLIDGIVISGLQADSYFLEELLKQKIEVLTEVNASNKTLAETALSLTLTILLYRQDLLTYNKVIDTFFHSDIRISTEETLAIYKTATKINDLFFGEKIFCLEKDWSSIAKFMHNALKTNLPTNNLDSVLGKNIDWIFFAYDRRIKRIIDIVPMNKSMKIYVALTKIQYAFSIEKHADNPKLRLTSSLMFFKDLKTIIKDHELNAAVSKTFELSLISETDLRKEPLTIIPVALKDHAFSLVVRKVHDIHIIAICNKSVYKGYNGLVYFIVDINKLFTSVFFRDLDGLRDYDINEKNSVGVPIYFEKIKELFLQKYAPDKISDAEKTILRGLKSIHQPKNQKVGNCTLTAAKVACLAAIILKSYDQYGKDYWIETIRNLVLHRYKTEISIPLREEYFKIAKEILPTKYPVLMGQVESKYIHYMQKVVPKNPI